MMKKSLYITLLTIILIATSCNREPVPPPEPVINYVTVRQLREMFDKGITTIDTSIYVRGIISLTPEMGNLPAFIVYLQDSTAGICLTVRGTNTFSRDSEVKIFCRGISFTLYNGLLQFGDISIADQTELISLTPAPLVPRTATISDLLSGKYQAEYVMLEDVQFTGPGTFSGIKTLTDCTSELDVYTRTSATFASEPLPADNGTIKGVASVFNTAQLLLRDETENEMTGDRCGGTGTVYLTEDFASMVRYDDVSTLTEWKTYPQEGTKTWYCNEVGTEKWVQATAYNSGQASVITWMISPAIDLSTATQPYVSFESANGYDTGATLKLYASTDYTGSTTPWTSTWTPLTFTQPPLNASGWSDFISSGKVDLSSFKVGTACVAWVYEGGGSKTTTWEVDNILVAEK
jgi:hypothetical protein